MKTYSKSSPVKLWYKEIENIFEDVPEVECMLEKNLLNFTNNTCESDNVKNDSPKSWFVQREPEYGGTSVFSCDKCNTDYLFKNDFFKHVRHLSRYEGEGKYSCHICGKLCLKDNLTKHARECHTKLGRKFQNIMKKGISKEQSLCEVCGMLYCSRRLFPHS